MYQGNSIGVVVPAYNEAAHVGRVIDTLPAFVDRAYVVDDASTDDTWSVILDRVEEASDADAVAATAATADGGEQSEGLRSSEELRSSGGEQASEASTSGQGPTVVPIRHEENRGVGGAIKTGYRRAREDDLEVVAVMGGDGQMDPALLSNIVDPVVSGEAAYAKGNRLRSSEDHDDMPAVRVIGNYLLTVLTKVASGYWTLEDPQNGYTAIAGDLLADDAVEEMYEYYGYCNDILVKLNAADARVADVPMPATYGEEESHIDLAEYVPRVSWMLFRNFLWRQRETYVADGEWAVPAGYAFGAVAIAAGVLGSVAAALGRSDRTGSSVGSLLVGILSLGLAVALDRRANRDLAVQTGETAE